MTTSAVAVQSKFSKEELAKKWSSLKNRLSKAQEVGTEMASRTFAGFAGLGGFSLAYYYRRRRQLANKQVTFDKKGKADAFFWGGLVVASAGILPFSGDAGRYITSAGIGIASAGSVDFLDNLAQEHHAKK